MLFFAGTDLLKGQFPYQTFYQMSKAHNFRNNFCIRSEQRVQLVKTRLTTQILKGLQFAFPFLCFYLIHTFFSSLLLFIFHLQTFQFPRPCKTDIFRTFHITLIFRNLERELGFFVDFLFKLESCSNWNANSEFAMV